MLDPKDIHILEQASKTLTYQFVPIFAAIFNKFLEEGFTREESLKVTMKFIEIFSLKGQGE